VTTRSFDSIQNAFVVERCATFPKVRIRIRNRWQSNEEREKNTSQRSPPIFKMWGTQLITIALNAYKMSVLSSSCYLFSYLAPPHSGCINCRSDISMGSSGNVGLKMVLYTKLAELHGEL